MHLNYAVADYTDLIVAIYVYSCLLAIDFEWIISYIPHCHGNHAKIYQAYKLKRGSSRLEQE